MDNTRNTNIASSKPQPLWYEHAYTLLLHAPSSSRALADILEDEYVAWEGRSAWCLSGPLKRLAYSKIDLSLLQHQSTSQAKHGRLAQNHQTFSSICLLGTLGPGNRRLAGVDLAKLELHEAHVPRANINVK